MADTTEDTNSKTPVEQQSSTGGGPAARVDIGKRAVALIIDAVIAVIAVVVGLVPIAGGIAATAYWLLRDGMDLEFMDHRSIGKKVMKLRPLTLDGQPLDMEASIERNFGLGGLTQLFAMTFIGLVIAIPLGLVALVIGIIEIVLVFTDPEGRRIGDKMAGTRVIETDA
jgi:uncharacterized RDD family membrane protein YckC